MAAAVAPLDSTIKPIPWEEKFGQSSDPNQWPRAVEGYYIRPNGSTFYQCPAGTIRNTGHVESPPAQTADATATDRKELPWAEVVRLSDELLKQPKFSYYHVMNSKEENYKAVEHDSTGSCNPGGYPCIHLIAMHPSTDKCLDAECWTCSIRDCPGGNEMHYDTDGCPDCMECNESECTNYKYHTVGDKCTPPAAAEKTTDKDS